VEEIIVSLLAIIGVLALIGVVAVLLALPVMWLLNYALAPSALVAVFGVAKIGIWKALGISTLSALLFKSYSSTKSK
jgi:hypothetical protein